MPESARRPAINDWFHRPAGERLAYVTDMMRELSRQTEPAAAARVYGQFVGRIMQVDTRISLSRRDLRRPQTRVTHSPRFERVIDPWLERDALPLIEGGVLADLIWDEAAVFDNDFVADPADPGYEHLKGIRSFAALPLFDGGESLNMVIVGRQDPGAFTADFLPEHLWLSNLFGRATSNLITRKELEHTYGRLERELRTVADIQKSLLPMAFPKTPGVDVAAYYQTSALTGGDYYDFFELPDGRLGLLIADVSGHGTPAAVMMAVTHAVAHTRPGVACPPSSVLEFVNQQLCRLYTRDTGTFVTAFYAVFDPVTRRLTFSSAGHNPPRLKRAGGGPSGIVQGEPALPLGIDADETYHDATQTLDAGDTLVLYTDGITEARAPGGEMFGTDRLDAAVRGCNESAKRLVDCVVTDVGRFTHDAPPQDDRTLLVVRV